MGRGAVPKCLQQEAELLLGLLAAQAQEVEDLPLDLGPVDTDRAAPALGAVDDQVVARRDAGGRIGLEPVDLVLPGHDEGVVLGLVTRQIVVVVEHGEVDHPQDLPVAFLDEPEVAGELQTQLAESLVCLRGAVSREEHGVARLEGELLPKLADDGAQVLGDTGREALRRVLGDGQPARPEGPHELVVAVGHLAGQGLGPSRHPDRLDHAPGLGQGVAKDAELGAGGQLGDVGELEAEPQVGLVGAVAAHGLGVGQDGNLSDVDAEDLLPELPDELAHDLEDVVAGDEAHLQVDLGELGLAVGAGVFIAEALADLQVAVAARDHEDLLEDLRALRQGVELAGVEP